MSGLSSPSSNDSQSLKYLDLFTIIKEKIDNYEWPENETIPTERELAERYQTSRTTVRKAIEHLRQKGYLHSEHGRGTFVLPELSRRSQRQLHGFTDDILARKGTPKQQILEFGFVSVNEPIRNALQLSGHTRVLRIKRVRFTTRPQWAFKQPISLSMKIMPLPKKSCLNLVPCISYWHKKWDLNYLKLMKRLALANPLPLKLHCSNSPFMMSF